MERGYNMTYLLALIFLISGFYLTFLGISGAVAGFVCWAISYAIAISAIINDENKKG